MNAQEKDEGEVRKESSQNDDRDSEEITEEKGTAGKYSVPAAGGMAPGDTGVTVPPGDNEKEKAHKEAAGEGTAGKKKANEGTNNEGTIGKEA